MAQGSDSSHLKAELRALRGQRLLGAESSCHVSSDVGVVLPGWVPAPPASPSHTALGTWEPRCSGSHCPAPAPQWRGSSQPLYPTATPFAQGCAPGCHTSSLFLLWTGGVPCRGAGQRGNGHNKAQEEGHGQDSWGGRPSSRATVPLSGPTGRSARRRCPEPISVLADRATVWTVLVASRTLICWKTWLVHLYRGTLLPCR